MLRDHQPIIIDKFNGLYQRGDTDSVPLDHFIDCTNIKFIADSAIQTRDGVGISQTVEVPLGNVRRFYNYPTPTGSTLIVLILNDDDEGEIYHVVDSATVYGPLLTLEGMVDFAFQPYAGRAYISPIGYYTITGFSDEDLNIEKGLEDEFLYVYMGDGIAARKAAGVGPTSGSLSIVNGAAGHTDPGFHLFGIVFEYDTGYLSPPGQITSFTTNANFSVDITGIETGTANVVKRHIVSTKVIVGYTGNTTGYQFFFIPSGIIDNNTETFIDDMSFFDADLLEDASYLLDNFTEIPAGAVLNLYHNRMGIYDTFDDISIGYLSAPGEPEAFNQITGLIVVPPDGNTITNAQELRDVNYVFKRTRTVAFVDNGDEPATWPMTVIDNALGSCIHGIATVLDSGASSVDYLIICNYKGINLFNGTFGKPELSWKIQDFWYQQDRNLFRLIQIINDPTTQRILLTIPDGRILEGNYLNGFDLKKIRWTPLGFPRNINTIAIVNIDEVILGMDYL